MDERTGRSAVDVHHSVLDFARCEKCFHARSNLGARQHVSFGDPEDAAKAIRVRHTGSVNHNLGDRYRPPAEHGGRDHAQ